MFLNAALMVRSKRGIAMFTSRLASSAYRRFTYVPAIMLLGLPTYAHSRYAEILLCTVPRSQDAAIPIQSCATETSSPDQGATDRPRLTIGRATDLAGRPLALIRAPRPVRDSADRSGGMRFTAGMMPSRLPVNAYSVTSGFGLRQHPLLGGLRAHSGLDLAAPAGAPIYATSDGVVSMADWRGGYGLFVALDHGGGVQTRYGHLSRLAVTSGQPVRKGDVIGLVGSTGMSTGPHLHYEVRLNGRAIDPARYLRSR